MGFWKGPLPPPRCHHPESFPFRGWGGGMLGRAWQRPARRPLSSVAEVRAPVRGDGGLPFASPSGAPTRLLPRWLSRPRAQQPTSSLCPRGASQEAPCEPSPAEPSRPLGPLVWRGGESRLGCWALISGAQFQGALAGRVGPLCPGALWGFAWPLLGLRLDSHQSEMAQGSKLPSTSFSGILLLPGFGGSRGHHGALMEAGCPLRLWRKQLWCPLPPSLPARADRLSRVVVEEGSAVKYNFPVWICHQDSEVASAAAFVKRS